MWRRGSESNRRIKVLQTFALPLGYRAQWLCNEGYRVTAAPVNAAGWVKQFRGAGGHACWAESRLGLRGGSGPATSLTL